MATRKFRSFIRQAWPDVEPARKYLASWHIDAIADHLQAVTEGHIKHLLITVPPGHAKSLIVAVLWPAWVWTRDPKWRCLAASYSGDLAMRDSVRCRGVIEGDWYQNLFRPAWKLSSVQNAKSWFDNTEKGFRLSLGVGGKATGFRGDCLLCLHGETLITTDQGPIPIRRIVEERLPVRVLGSSGRWRRILAYHQNPGRATVMLETESGKGFGCTPDHPVFVEGRGYVPIEDAIQLGIRQYLRVLQDGATNRDRLHRVYESGGTPDYVYNLNVDVDHDYYANGILAHNCDDPLNAKEQFSNAALNEAIFWWDQVMSSRLNSLIEGSKVIIMQRLSERDLAAHVLESGGYEHLNLPTEYDPSTKAKTTLILNGVQWEDPRTEPGELLFPALFPRKAIEEAKKNLGAQGFAAQHQQRPSPAEGGLFQRHHWRYWQRPGQNLLPVVVKHPDGSLHQVAPVTLPEKMEFGQSWDFTFKDVKTADYVVGQLWGRNGADRFLIEQDRGRKDFPKSVEAIRAMSARHPRSYLKLVEDKANGTAIIATLKHEVPGIVAVNPEGGKYSRASSVAPQVESGNVFLPHPAIAPWVDTFIEELAGFPNGAHDDQCDAFSQILLRWNVAPTPSIRRL